MLVSLLRQFSRVSLGPVVSTGVRSISSTQPLNFQLTQSLYGEPLKKKKRLDPAIVKAREERRRKKIEKQIRRLQKNARQLKPIDELEVPLNILDTQSKRQRAALVLPLEETEARACLQKEWARWKLREHEADVRELDRVAGAQRRALDQLLLESEELYDEALAPDMQLVGFTARGPVATPPIPRYDSPDGEYIDVSKKWDN